MKIFLDQPLNGMKKFLETFGYEVSNAFDKKMSTSPDDVLVSESIEKGYLFITNNNDAAQLARMRGANFIQIDMAFLAKAVHRELQSQSVSE